MKWVSERYDMVAFRRGVYTIVEVLEDEYVVVQRYGSSMKVYRGEDTSRSREVQQRYDVGSVNARQERRRYKIANDDTHEF